MGQLLPLNVTRIVYGRVAGDLSARWYVATDDVDIERYGSHRS